MFKRLKQVAGALVLMAGLGAGLTVFAGQAGATPTNPGPNTSCTAGTDHCSAWLPSKHNPCTVYNVLWDHIWEGAPGGRALWHVVAALYQVCGGVSYVGNTADIYTSDWEVPTNWISADGTYSGVRFIAHSVSGNNVIGWGTGNVVRWSNCYQRTTADVFTAYDAQPSGTFTPGDFSTTAGCYDSPGDTLGISSGTGRYNGSYTAWYMYQINYGGAWGTRWTHEIQLW